MHGALQRVISPDGWSLDRHIKHDAARDSATTQRDALRTTAPSRHMHACLSPDDPAESPAENREAKNKDNGGGRSAERVAAVIGRDGGSLVVVVLNDEFARAGLGDAACGRLGSSHSTAEQCMQSYPIRGASTWPSPQSGA